MVISFDWLKQYIKIDKRVEEVASDLTGLGLEVEGVSEYALVKGGLKGLIIGEVEECQSHPNADRLKLTKVNVGNGEPLPIVCGAPNVASGQKVIVATVGTTLYPAEGDSFKIKKSKIRGEVSMGMICAEDEIGLGTNHNGIMVLESKAPIGMEASEYLNIQSDYLLEIGLTPNRADAASHYGVARDLKALYQIELQTPDVSTFKVANTDADITVEVENSEACPRYSGLVIKGLKVKESPEWLQNRLKTIGINPTNNVVDATNFVLHELGQPLHAFDLSKVGNKVIVKSGLKGVKFKTLDEKERTLGEEDLMICNAQEPMCIAGVLGGMESGVTEQTTDIFLECAYFAPDYVRKTSMKHGIKTDACFRYERGTDPNITVYALKRAATLILEVAGGVVSSDIIDEYPSPISNRVIELSYSRLNKLIGQDIEKIKIKKILEGLEISINKEDGDSFEVSVPPYRVDVTREADILEEILRVYGYNNFEHVSVKSDFIARVSSEDDKKLLQNRVSSLLTDRGFSEIYTNSITNSEYVQKVGFLHDDRLIKILNYNSEDLDVLRTNMIFGGLEVLKSNLNRKVDNIRFYEFGNTYNLVDGARVEKEKLMILMYGSNHEETWVSQKKPLRFIDLQAQLQALIEMVGAQKIKYEPMESGGKYEYGLKLLRKKEIIGRAGVLSHAFNELFSIEKPIFYAEIDWLKFIERRGEVKFKSLSKYPKVKRDLSLVLDKKVDFKEVEKVTFEVDNKILQSLNVFDVYVGENIGPDKKSYSIRYELQDLNKTLVDKEIDKVMDKLIKAYEHKLGAIIRK